MTLAGPILSHLKPLIFASACVLSVGCDERGPAGPTVPLGREFTLEPGQTASLEGTSFRVRFLRVSGDSRCPADVVCVQGGDAVVHVRAADGGSAEYELHTGDQARAVAAHAGFRIVLERLQPYPFSSRAIQPEEYRATLTVGR